MKTRQGHVQGYNAQTMVTADQCIVSAEITQDKNDVRQLEPMLSAMEATLEAAGAFSAVDWRRCSRNGR